VIFFFRRTTLVGVARYSATIWFIHILKLLCEKKTENKTKSDHRLQLINFGLFVKLKWPIQTWVHSCFIMNHFILWNTPHFE
jgi:hypothetical protein